MKLNSLAIGFACCLASTGALSADPINASSSGSVIGDDVLYSIGGGNAVTMGSAGNMDSISVGGGWNNNLVCGNMNLNTTLENQLNGATAGFQNIMTTVVSNATGAIASMPALILQRSNPALYNLLVNGILHGVARAKPVTGCNHIREASRRAHTDGDCCFTTATPPCPD
jgi:integrating conjugative element protein (TIGR03755 family)